MQRLTLLLLALSSLLVSAPLLAESAEPAPTSPEATSESATFSMYCYWTGEATLGRVPGVLRSRIGHQGGAEVVWVEYDPARTNVGELTRALKAQNSFYSLLVGDGEAKASALEHLKTANFKKADVKNSDVKNSDVKVVTAKPHWIEPKHSLRTRYPQLAALELEEWQAIALNSWSYFGGPMPDVLTEEQKEQLAATR